MVPTWGGSVPAGPRTQLHDGCAGRRRRLLYRTAPAIKPLGELLLDALEEVPVDAEGHARVRVAHPLGDCQDVRSVIDQ